MSVREMVYPDYSVEAFVRGDIRLRFNSPGSKFGPVYVVLTADDGDNLLDALAKALVKADAAEAAVRVSVPAKEETP